MGGVAGICYYGKKSRYKKISLVVIPGETEFLVQNLFKCEKDPYHSETNRAGYVNLGTAVNALVEDLISDRLTKVNISMHCNATYRLSYDYERLTK